MTQFGKFLLSMTLVFWLFTHSTLHAQVIKGRITDVKGNPVNSATLFIRELKQGTATNDEGYYELKVEAGVYTCVFQCLGYETETRTITVGTGTNTHNITLIEMAYQLKEVVINNKREDPAYGIMRRAIAMAPYYLNQVSEYKADVYLKGSFKVIRIAPLVKRFVKSDDLKDFKEGNSYVEESFNEIEFAAPNKYRQKVIKKTGSMPNSEGNSAMSFITNSIYDPKAFLEVIISPLSTIAFSHYRFRYEGFIEEGNRIINKIKITPSHKGKQLLTGYIYIVDNFWNVHSIDVSGEFMMGINFRVQINFGEVNENVWMPISHRMDFDGSILGNKGAFQYVSSVKYNQITENTSIRKPDALVLAEQQRRAMQRAAAVIVEKEEPKSKTSAKIETIMEKEKLSNREAYQLARLMQKEAEAEKKENQSLDLTEELRYDYKTTYDSLANKRDTAFWEMMRPVPLNPDELRSYQEKEIKLAVGPQPKDTTKTVHKAKPASPFIRTTKKVLWGTNIKLGKNGGTIDYRGLKPSQYGFNTVNGFYIGQELTWSKNFPQKKVTRLSVTPEAVWAINRKAVMWDVNASLSYAPMRRASAWLSFGQTSSDFSNVRSIYPFENTISSLFFRYNYLKLYENNFVTASNTIDIANGLQLTANVKYARRNMLDNHSDYSFFFRDARDYTSNIPRNVELETVNPELETSNLKLGTSATFMLNLNYTPKYFYRIVGNNQKRMVKSDFPTFAATWQKGVSGVFGSDSNFDQLTLGIWQNLTPGLMQKFSYMARGGAFVNRKSVSFPDFRHFSTVEIPVTMGSISQQSAGGGTNISSFCLLEYYRYSTSDKYFEAHLYYETPFLLLKFLPYFRNRMLWMEGLQLNYLYTSGIKNYTELGYTIGLGIQAGVFVGFENFKYRSFGVKLSVPLGRVVGF